MGLDLALGGLVLLVALRGWLRGFVVQAIRLGALVCAVYAAVPARNFVKPYALQHLPTVRADLSDRLLWWVMAVACYFLFSGLASLIVAISRRNSFGLEEKNRSDQFAGLGLGLVKGVIVAAFALSGLQTYGEPAFSKLDWAQSQTKESMAWDWGQKYQPARRLWTSQPVQQFVSHVQKNGLNPPAAVPTRGAGEEDVEKPVQTASRIPRLEIAGSDTSIPGESGGVGLSEDLAREVEKLRKELSELDGTR